MGVRDLILKLGLRNWERAKEFSKQIQTSVQKSTDLSKEARRELVGAIRERTQAARLLVRRAAGLQGRADALGEASAQGPDGLGLLGRTALFRQGRKVFGGAEAILAGGGLGVAQDVLGDVAGKAGVAAIAAAVIQQVKAYVDSEFAKLEGDREALVRELARDELRTFEERLRAEPIFAQEQAERAAAEHSAYERALAQSGLTPAVEYLEGD